MDLSNNEKSVCRICLNNQHIGEDYISVEDYASVNFENILIKKVIEIAIPELDLDISNSPVICMSCYELILNSYILKSKYYETEQRIYTYIEANDFKFGDKIDLLKVNKIPCERKLNNEENCALEMVVIKSDVAEDESIAKTINSINDIECEINSEDEKSNYFNQECDRIDHSYPKRSYSCNKCEYKGYRLDLLKKHLKKCKVTKKSDLFECDTCSYATCRKRNLKRHQMTHGGERPYICGICNKGFTELNHMKSHMYKHSNLPKPFQCLEKGCKSHFSRKCDLNAHMIKHAIVSTFDCEMCKKSFPNKAQLENHKKLQHKKSKNKTK